MKKNNAFSGKGYKRGQQIKRQLIAEISDDDFGFTHQKPLKGDKTRFNVRCILQNNNGEICIVKSEKHGYIQIPGGGINDKETIIDALRREVQEETGHLITGIKPISYILEKRGLEIAKCIKKNNMNMGK